MDLDGHTLRSMNVDGYRHNYEGFYDKSTYQKSINRERTTIIEGAHVSIMRILSFISLPLLLKSF